MPSKVAFSSSYTSGGIELLSMGPTVLGLCGFTELLV